MGRPKKSAPSPAEIEPEEISQELPEEEPEADEEEDDEPEAASGGKAISKAAAVRDALEQGEDGPEDGVAYIKKIHGIEISKQMFSSYKTQEKARQAKNSPKGKPGRKPREVAESSQVAPEPKPATADGQSELIEALEAMKPLVASLGAEKVKRLVDLLG